MGLTGTQHAITPARSALLRSGAGRSGWPILVGVRVKKYALSGVARSGATRSGYHSGVLCMSVGGVHRAGGKSVQSYKIQDLSIQDILNEQPNTASFKAKGFTPTEGMAVIATLGSTHNLTRLFAGKIIRVVTSYEGTPSTPVYACSAIDPTWGMNKRRVYARFVGATVNTIVSTLVSTYASGYTVSVSSDIASLTIDEITYTDEDLTAALSRTVKRVGGYWRCDYTSTIRVFIHDTGTIETDPTTINTVHSSFSNLRVTHDLSQVVTRVYVEGGGANALEAIAVGETVIPVENGVWYQSTGGVVACGPQRITYTGRTLGGGGSLVGTGAAPAAAAVVALASGSGVNSGAHNYGVTFVTGSGESIVSPLATITTGNVSAPSTSPATGTATIGTGPNAGSHDYAVTFVTSAGETTASSTVTQATGLTDPPTTSPTPGAATAGSGVDDGNHDYAVTFVTSIGETTPGPIGSQVTAGSVIAPLIAPTIGTGTEGTGPEVGNHDYAVTFVNGAGETTPGPRISKTVGDTTTAPASAPTLGTPTLGTGPDPGAHDYAITFVTAVGETTASSTASVTTSVTTAPSSAPTLGTAALGSGPDPGAHDYAVTFVTSAGETTVGPTASRTTTVTTAPASAPTAGSPSPGSGPDIGTHAYKVTFVTSIGETTPSSASNTITTSGFASPTGVNGNRDGLGSGSLGAGDYQYGVTFITATGETTPSTPITVNTTNVAKPATPTASAASSGGFFDHGACTPGGHYKFKITFVNANGETIASDESNDVVAVDDGAGGCWRIDVSYANSDTAVRDVNVYRTTAGGSTYYFVKSVLATGANINGATVDDATLVTHATEPGANTAAVNRVSLSVVPTGPTGVTSRKIYRTTVGGSQLKLLATLGDNTTTTYSDTTADGSLGANAPSTNSALNAVVALTGIPTGDANVTARNIYRTVAGGSTYKLLTTISNNSATTYTDTTVDASLGASAPSSNTAYVCVVALSGIPTGPSGTTQRKIYRTVAGGSTLKLLTTLANNSTTTFSDTVADASLGADAPSTNTAQIAVVALSAIPRGASNVTSRRVYRTVAGGSQLKLVATIANNTATTYSDTTPDASLGANVPTSNTAYLQVIPLTGIPLGGSTVTQRKIYRTTAGGSTLKLLATLADNTTTSYSDGTADASLGANAPGSNTATANVVPLTGIPIGDANVTSRKLYRRSGGAGLKLLATIADNTTTTYSDTTANASLGAAVPSSNTAYLQRIPLTSIPTGGSLVTSRKIYRTAAGGTQLKLVTTIADNTTTSYTDTVTDASLGANVPVSNTAAANQVSVSGIPIGAAAVTSRKVYRTVAGGSQLKLLTTIADNTSTTYTDSTADGSLGANVPTSDTSGLTQPQGNVIAGSTSLVVAGAGAFPSTGAWVVIGNGTQAVRYSGISGNTLTGIPASGVGSIQATVGFNSTVTLAPCLTGVPSSGAGSIVYALVKGDPVNLVVQVDDTTKQTALAALIGGDGIQEDSLSDNRLAYTEAAARGAAWLDLHGDTEVAVEYDVRDFNTRSGRHIQINLGTPFSLATSFTIQSVTIGSFEPLLPPTYQVSASSTRFSFEDLLRRAQEVGA